MTDDGKRKKGADAEEPGKDKAEDAPETEEKAEVEAAEEEAKAPKEGAEDEAEETAADDDGDKAEDEPEEAAEAADEGEDEDEADDEASEEKAEASAEEADEDEDGHDHHHGGPVKRGEAIVLDDPDAVGLCAFFDHPADIMAAAEKARDKGFKNWDVYTPFPVHGMDEAMGIGRSFMPYITFALALTGLTFALTLQFGTLIFDWPIIIGGKPTDFSGTIGGGWPSFAPISFELTVLFAGIGSALVMFAINGLPNLKPRLLDWRLTRDRFALWVSANDEQYDHDKTLEFLESLEPVEVREVKSET